MFVATPRIRNSASRARPRIDGRSRAGELDEHRVEVRPDLGADEDRAAVEPHAGAAERYVVTGWCRGELVGGILGGDAALEGGPRGSAAAPA